MKYGLTSTLNDKDCLVLGIFKQELDLNIPKEKLDVINRLKTQVAEPGDIVSHNFSDGQIIILIQCGDKENFSLATLKQQLATTITFILKQKIISATIAFPELETITQDKQLEHMLLQFEAQRYQFLEFKTEKKTPYAIKSIEFYLPKANSQAIKTAEAIAKGMHLTKNLANLPANICTPSYIAQQAKDLAKKFDSIKTKIVDKDLMHEMGMGALLAVAKGSIEPPQLIEAQYHGADKHTPPVVLVGKGITFDSGGISLKPAVGMEEMKFDMAGAASVLGTLKACALMQLPINVIGLMACAENMPGGRATKPGDVVKSMSGLTIEITNTDAEGRLVLADALTYATQFKPRFVIDIATLTGAVIIALGHASSGLMTQDDELANLILSASQLSGDKTWRLPLDSDYMESLDSPIADMVNSTAERVAGSVTAGCFLSKFAKNYRWAHLDIAGTAWNSGKNRCATGRPVPLLVQILRQVAYEN